MDYKDKASKSPSPSDYAGVSQAASDLRSHLADDMVDFSAPQPQKVKAEAIEKAQKFREFAGEKATAMKQEAGVKIKQGAEKAKELHATAEDYVRENPTKAVLGAVGVGVIIGLILRR
jgi:ElaB/YqjD/DUF883 family membrane-anchored ribosome-binding protein